MVSTKPSPSIALLAALIMPTATRADVIRIQMSPAAPLNSAQRSQMIPTLMIAAIEEVHNSCATEIFNTCQPAPSTPQDPFESFFGLPPSSAGARDMVSFGGIGGGMHSDPFGPMRTMIDSSDPFLRLATTPPTSPLTSIGLIDEIVGDFDRMVDDMMNSAIRFGMAADDGSRTMSRQREERAQAEEGEEQKESDASPADLAEAALERMVNSFFGHVVSASAATRPSAESDDTPIVVQETNVEVDAEKNEQEDEDHPQAPRVSDGDVQREVLSHDDSSPDSIVQVPDKADDEPSESLDNIEASYGDGGGLDPIAMAKRIVQRGKTILETEEAGDNDSELRRRRRLTVEDGPEPEVRRRLARRLTEVVPFVGMPTRVVVFPFEGGLRVVIRELEGEKERQRPAPVQHAGATPRLMLGCSVDSCLWDMYDGNQVSDQCAASLSKVRSVHSQLLEDEERRERGMMATLNSFATTENSEDADGVSPILFFVWLGFFVTSIYACLSCGGDDEDNDEEYNPEDYFVLADDEGNAPRTDYILIHSPLCMSFSATSRSAPRDDESGVYTGIPVV